MNEGAANMPPVIRKQLHIESFDPLQLLEEINKTVKPEVWGL
jgi:hypothetical protein